LQVEDRGFRECVRRSVGGGVGGDAQAGTNFRKFLVEGTKPNLKKIKEYVERSLMLVTALSPVIGYDKASHIAH
jgi:aspartate ammonia-lyase